MRHKIRTTMRPDRVIEVGDGELLDLERQGVVFSGPDAEPAAEPAAAGWPAGGLASAAQPSGPAAPEPPKPRPPTRTRTATSGTTPGKADDKTDKE